MQANTDGGPEDTGPDVVQRPGALTWSELKIDSQAASTCALSHAAAGSLRGEGAGVHEADKVRRSVACTLPPEALLLSGRCWWRSVSKDTVAAGGSLNAVDMRPGRRTGALHLSCRYPRNSSTAQATCAMRPGSVIAEEGAIPKPMHAPPSCAELNETACGPLQA